MQNRKKYGLKASRKPQKHQLLSGVAHVGCSRGKGYAHFRFTEDFVDAVGKKLPQGLSPHSPGYLKVLNMPGTQLWKVYAFYLHREVGALLWEEQEYPNWLTPPRFPD